MKYFLTVAALSSLALFLVVPVLLSLSAYAAPSFNVDINVNGGNNPGSGEIPPGRAFTLGDITDIIENIVRWLIYISGTLAVFFIVLSGIMYMYAGNDPAGVKKAQDMFKSALIGAAIILAVGTILWTIQGLVTGEFFGL